MRKFYKNLVLLLIPMLIFSITMLNVKVTAASTVKIGVLFPKYLTQGGGGFGGSGHGGLYDGAQMAAQEINTAGGINVGGTMENIELDFQDEGALDPTLIPPNYNTAITTASMTEMLTAGCQFIVGGFRTETTQAALSVLKSWNTGGETPVPFWICGSATSALINNNQTANPGGQWVFRVTPINDTMLLYTVTNYLKQYLVPKLAKMYTNATYPTETPGQFRYAVIAEDLTWTQSMALYLTAPAGYGGLPLPGYNYFLGPNVTTSGVLGTGGAAPIPGRNLVPSTGYDFSSLVSTLKAEKVRLIIDIFTMPEVNNLIAAVKAAEMPAMVMGIDVPGQQQSHWSDTSGAANYECLLCWSGTGTEIVPGYSEVFFKNFCGFSGGYWPMYTASGAYDAIYGIKEAIESAGTTDPNTLLPVIRATNRIGLSGQFKYTTSNDEFCNSMGINWSAYGDKPYGWARSEIVQWIQNATDPGSPYPNVGAQMNVVSPTRLNDTYAPPYARKTVMPPSMYELANWDVNFDGKVNMADVGQCAKAFGGIPSKANWNMEVDTNTDGKIDMKDIGTIAKNFGKNALQWPLP
ncbi:dockerin type I domain-containing protein [Candidatus Bathyarchaeota archaeon]|nr:dockerin type I domain-containing protein [Candidatus Bathyarchaeota archaeon]